MHRLMSGMTGLVGRAHAAVVRGAMAREEGQGTVEYVMLGGVVVLAVIAAASGAVGGLVTAIVTEAQTAITGAI